MKKIDSKQEKYNALSEITDLVGIRIIIYLESEVDLVANLIKREFTEDKTNSTDKRRGVIQNFAPGYGRQGEYR